MEEKKTGCSGNCGSCSKECGDRTADSLLAPTGEFNDIKHVIGVVSGKGGVGKSLVTSTLAVLLQKMGYKVGILDADITGPSIPKTFGLNTKVYQNDLGIIPAETKTGIKIMSINLLLPEDESPVLWRGPVIAGAVKQFWQDVVWGELDYLLVDCPPGTGDVPLTVFQSLPLDGAIIVTSPQDLVSMIVKKAYNMAEMMNISVLGIIENMSYVVCPECGEEFKIFGSGSDTIAKDLGVDLLGKMPIDILVAKLVDSGRFEEYQNDYLKKAAEKIIEKTK